jgi:hypothetical protein
MFFHKIFSPNTIYRAQGLHPYIRLISLNHPIMDAKSEWDFLFFEA